MPTPSYKLEWDKSGEHFYETGIDHGVLYPISAQGAYDTGEAWNGISAVTEKPSGAEATAVWADNQKYLNLYSAEEFAATLAAYTYPDGFMECDGSAEIAPGVFAGQQNRKMFGLSRLQDPPHLWRKGFPVRTCLQHHQRLSGSFRNELGNLHHPGQCCRHESHLHPHHRFPQDRRR